jgi:hypothetical protein
LHSETTTRDWTARGGAGSTDYVGIGRLMRETADESGVVRTV